MLSVTWRYVRRHHLGLLALFVALGGTSFAVAKNSVGSREIENGSVRSKDLRNNGVKGVDVRSGTLNGSDIADGSLLAGDLAPGVLSSAAVVVRHKEFTVGATSATQARAECQPGERAVGGGVGFNSSPGSNDAVIYSNPGKIGVGGFPDAGVTPDAWDGGIRNSESGSKTARVYVVCMEG